MWVQLTFLLFALFLCEGKLLTYQESSVNEFSGELDKWATTGLETQRLRKYINLLKFPTSLQRLEWRSYSGPQEAAICTVCLSTMKTFINLRREGMSNEGIMRNAIKLCTLLNIQPENVCKGAVEINAPIIIYIADARPNLTEGTICGVLLDSKYCPLNDPEYDWTINVDTNHPQQIPQNENRAPIKIAQITDLHYDPLYEPYGNANCLEPTCCRKGQNVSTTDIKIAGYWGDYNYCDTPWHGIVDVLNHVRDNHKDVDYIYFTGDIVDHGVWETTKIGNIDILNKSYDQISETFKGIPFYPTLGNHEPHPLNQFAPKTITREDLTTEWVYKLVADLWIGHKWLPEETRETIIQGGFYTVVPRKGFRIITLNSNVCYCYNWWILYQPRDPDNQLQWLSEVLLKAEQNQEFVHILSHIPVGHRDCLRVWKREYLKIISRFSHIITAQFNGHTHNDELEVMYDENLRPMSVAWNGGSTTAYTNLNPNYKVYLLNEANFAVQNYENWMYNLTAANLRPNSRPEWFVSYNFKEEYGLREVNLEELKEWVRSVAKDEKLLDKYYRHYYKNAEPSLRKPCSKACKKNLLCQTVTGSLSNEQFCQKIMKV